MEIFNIETYNDERADRFFDVFHFMDGQVTISKIKQYQFSGWHMHKKQIDYFCVVKGNLDVYVIDLNGCLSITTLSSALPRSIKIEKGEIHSWKSNNEEAILIYHLSRKHDESDEYRFNRNEILNKTKPEFHSLIISIYNDK